MQTPAAEHELHPVPVITIRPAQSGPLVMAFALPVDADKPVVIARNVSELWLVNLVRMVKLPALGQLSLLAKMVLKDNGPGPGAPRASTRCA